MLIVSHLLLNLLTTVYPRVIDLSIFNNKFPFLPGQWFVIDPFLPKNCLKNQKKSNDNIENCQAISQQASGMNYTVMIF